MAEVKTQGAVEAMEVAEASRETEWEKPSFVGDLFLGKLNLDLIHPFPEQPQADKAEADEFLKKLEYLQVVSRREFAGRNLFVTQHSIERNLARWADR